jgi:hypothetical protein
MRAGHFVQQSTGYVAFDPSPLPPDPPVRLEGELLFVAMYVRQEAVLSSQIEGTQASLTDVLQFEAGEREDSKLRDIQ